MLCYVIWCAALPYASICITLPYRTQPLYLFTTLQVAEIQRIRAAQRAESREILKRHTDEVQRWEWEKQRDVMKSIVCWAARRIRYMEQGEVRAIARKMIALGEEPYNSIQCKITNSSIDEKNTEEDGKLEYAQIIMIIMS
jgi:hypothetical protein